MTGVENSGISGALNCGTKEQRPQTTITSDVTKNTTYGYSASTAEYLQRQRGEKCYNVRNNYCMAFGV